MIGYLHGTIRTTANPLIVDVHDVGYTVHITEALRSRITVGSVVSLRIHPHITEGTFDLYGFESDQELYVFSLLLSVSGIGPKTALATVGKGVAEVQQAVVAADVDFFTSIPRLGKKNAQKLIIELKTKLGDLTDLDLSEPDSDTVDVLEALISMGFDKTQSKKVLQQLNDQQLTVQERMKQAIKQLGKRP